MFRGCSTENRQTSAFQKRKKRGSVESKVGEVVGEDGRRGWCEQKGLPRRPKDEIDYSSLRLLNCCSVLQMPQIRNCFQPTYSLHPVSSISTFNLKKKKRKKEKNCDTTIYTTELRLSEYRLSECGFTDNFRMNSRRNDWQSRIERARSNSHISLLTLFLVETVI